MTPMTKDVEELTEISEDIASMSPGQMLAKARGKLGFSQQNIATKLNFRLSLVENIEADVFDPCLPATFNRGYLCTFAKLVNITNDDILKSYDNLNVAKIECAELHSFSRSTHKEAQNSLMNWIGYFIVAILIGSTIVWWFQGVDKKDITTSSETIEVLVGSQSEDVLSVTDTPIQESESQKTLFETQNIVPEPLKREHINNSMVNESLNGITNNKPQVLTAATAIFTFTGDCWVSIYDATGDRVAYGVKKTGYVMTITGKPPFKVDIGRPALTSIEFNGESVDMSRFDKDNIAKFTLPIIE
jgi:cytoskeleton protein RodZ